MTRFRAVSILLAVLAVLFVATRWFGLGERRPNENASPALGAFDRGMSLRQTFESLPESGAGRASLRLFADNTEAWVERWRLLDSAEESIDVSYFILHEDIFGLSFLGHLLERARAGVRVRILVDGFGTRMSREIAGNGFLEELASTANVTVRTYRPLWRRWTEALLTLRPSAIVASEHDKIIVVDGRRSLIGGRNIAVEYFSDPSRMRNAFKDLDLRIDSEPVASALRRAFEAQLESEDAVVAVDAGGGEQQSTLLRLYRAMDDWLHGRPFDVSSAAADAATPDPWLEQLQASRPLHGRLRKLSPAAVQAETRILDSQARFHSPDDPITEALRRLVQTARKEIFAQTPYVVLSEAGVRLLEDAARRGVAITIVTNSPVSSDNALSQAFFLEQWPEIMARVPTLRLFVAGREHNLHAKAVTFDAKVALVGTYNLDPVSMAFNSEVMAATWSEEVARLTDLAARRAIERGEPEIFEYRIRRAPDGSAVIGDDGQVAIAFGPSDHCTPEEWTALAAYWGVIRASKEFVGFSPLL